MNPPRTVTLRNVAQAAGFAPSTVSRALRNDPRLPEETRREIAAVATRLGYRANPLATAFMAHLRGAKATKYTSTFAFLLSTRAAAANWGHRVYLEHCQRYAESLGYQVEQFLFAENGMTPARMSSILRTRGVQGIILPATRPSEPQCDLEWEHFAAAVIGTRHAMPSLHMAATNHFQNTLLACAELRALGYRRIGFHMKALIDEWTLHRSRAAFLYAQSQWPRSQHVPLLITPELDPAQFWAWKQRHSPDAILSAHIEVRDWLLTSDIRIPEDIGYANTHVIPAFGPCAGILQLDELVSQAAVDLVIGQLLRNERGLAAHPKTVLVDGEWVSGAGK